MGTTNYNFETVASVYNTIAKQNNTIRNNATQQIDSKIKDVEDTLFAFMAGTSQAGPCRFATTGNIVLSGTQLVDGGTPVLDDRILVWQQTDQKENGIYLYKPAGAWVRADDEIIDNLLTTVREGATYSERAFIVTTNDPITIGVTNIVITPFPVNGSIGTAALNMNADLPMNSHKITTLSDGMLATDAVNKGQMDAGDATAEVNAEAYADANFVNVDGTNPMVDDLDFGGFKGVNAADPVNPQDLVTKAFGDANYSGGSFNGGTITGDLNLDGADYKQEAANDSAGGSLVIAEEVALNEKRGGRSQFSITSQNVYSNTSMVAGGSDVNIDLPLDVPLNAKWVLMEFYFTAQNNTAGGRVGVYFYDENNTNHAVWRQTFEVAALTQTYSFQGWLPVHHISGTPRAALKLYGWLAESGVFSAIDIQLNCHGYSLI